MEGKSYRDLEAWQEAMALVQEVYRATGAYPREQVYSLTQQTQKSAVSVPSNIAEGHGRKRQGEFAYHVRVSRGSLCELETQLLVAHGLRYLSDEQMEGLNARIQTVGRLLNGLLRYLERELANQ